MLHLQCLQNLSPAKVPNIHPRLLWIISSNSNKPLQSTSWLTSIADDIIIPTIKPCHHFNLLLNIPGSKNQTGNNNNIFKRFSWNKPPSVLLPILPHLPIFRISFHDQNTSSWYCLSPGVLVKTVDSNITARNVRSNKQCSCANFLSKVLKYLVKSFGKTFTDFNIK